MEKKGGFLLKKNSAEFAKRRCKGKSLCVGQVVQCVVLAGPDTRAVPVSVNPSDVGVAVMSSEHVVGVGSLLPGQLVKTAVKEVCNARTCTCTWRGHMHAHACCTGGV